MLRIEAGALNPDDFFAVTLSFGASVWLPMRRSSSLGLRVLLQSQNRNSGTDLTSDARTFAMVDWELAREARGPQQRQVLLRLGAGAVFRSPYRTAPVAEAAVGWRYRLVPHLRILGTLSDMIAWLPEEIYQCPPAGGSGSTACGIPGGLQHNFGILLAAELGL